MKPAVSRMLTDIAAMLLIALSGAASASMDTAWVRW